ncbi:MAG TPA: mechanosensitive ion channel domain-containing protein [Myxococcaceae bacterium]|nr:mechanosensitive ion channel domain-containing protein [Myxococcaceae bacterium]
MKSRAPTLILVLLLGGSALAAEAEERPAASPTGVIRIRDRSILELHVARGVRSAQARARDATETLSHVLELPGPDVVRIEPRQDGVALLVGETPIVELASEDARAVGNDDLSLYATAAAQRLDAGLKAERQRLQIQDAVFSVSLAVFITLLAFLALRLVGRLGRQLQESLLADRERVAALRLGTVEIASRRMMRGGIRLGLVAGALVLQLVVLYVWVLSVLSLFRPTREYGAQLTGSVLRPAGALLGRIGASLPILVVAAVFALAVALVFRTLRLFFESIARGETRVRWISPELATPVGTLVRGGFVVLAVVFAAPLITGEDTGALSRLGTAVLVVLATAAVPLLASVAVGLPTVLRRTVRPGEMVELGGRQGQVRAVTLLEVQLEDGDGAELRVPHLVAFLHPTRALGTVPRRSLEVLVASAEDQLRVQSVLLEAAGSHASGARAELVSLDGRGARWRVSGIHPDLGLRVATALRDARIPLGQPTPGAPG